MIHPRQPGLFDVAERAGQLTEMGDPLVGLKARIDWEAFRPDLGRVREKDRKSNAGAKTKCQICVKDSRLTEAQKQLNWNKSKVRARVKPVFGAQAAMGGHLERTIGQLRAKVMIGLMNLVYHMARLMQLIKLNSKSAGPGGIDNHREGAPIAV